MSSGLRAGDAVVVTGGADGIGKAIAFALAREKVRIAIFDIDREKGPETEKALHDMGAEAVFYPVDMGSGAEIEKAAARATSDFGPMFGLINNAAIFPRALVSEATEALWQRVLAVNLIGPVLCAKAFLPGMQKEKRGVIVNVGSGLGPPKPRRAHYVASKLGLISFTKSLAVEVAPDIRVVCVVPGLTETAQPLQDLTREQLHAIGANVPMGRAAQPEDIAPLVMFLLSSGAGYITGQTIAADGGMAMVP